MDQLCESLPEYQGVLRKLLTQQCLSLLSRFPHFLVALKDLNTQTLGDWVTETRRELIIALCWAVGNYTRTTLRDLTSELVAAVLTCRSPSTTKCWSSLPTNE